MAKYRQHEATFFVTEEEWELISNNAKQSGYKTVSSYLRSVAIDTKIINIDYSDLRPFTIQLHRIGTNINQITRQVNTQKGISDADMILLKDCLAKMDKLENDLYSLSVHAKEKL